MGREGDKHEYVDCSVSVNRADTLKVLSDEDLFNADVDSCTLEALEGGAVHIPYLSLDP